MELTVNGTGYEVGLAALSRSLRKAYKYQVTTEDGRVHSETRAMYADFTLSLGNVDPAEYDRLLAALAMGGEFTVELPETAGGRRAYTGVFDGVTDGVLLQNGDGTLWDNLELSFTGTAPLEVGA